MKFVLTCDCGNTEFAYLPNKRLFVCSKCKNFYLEEEAGHELLGEED